MLVYKEFIQQLPDSPHWVHDVTPAAWMPFWAISSPQPAAKTPRNGRLHHEKDVTGFAGEVLGDEGGSEEKEIKEDEGAYLVQAVRAAGKCDAVFKGFSDCLLKLGDSMANYPQGLDDKTSIKTVCTYWEDFHSCTVTALTDCQEGAKDMWDKLRKESKNLNIQGSLFELCGGGNGAAGPVLPALPLLLAALCAALATWLSF